MSKCIPTLTITADKIMPVTLSGTDGVDYTNTLYSTRPKIAVFKDGFLRPTGEKFGCLYVRSADPRFFDDAQRVRVVKLTERMTKPMNEDRLKYIANHVSEWIFQHLISQTEINRVDARRAAVNAAN